MIILLGPDGTGKTTFAKKLEDKYGKPYYHFTKDSNYKDYLLPLVHLDMTNAVLDRHAICEYPYSIVMNRPFKFNIKQWHNIMTMTLIQKPVILLFTHKPLKHQYPENQYMPYDKWDQCLDLYRDFLTSNNIPYREYDYASPDSIESIFSIESGFNAMTAWWRTDWQNGYGCVGSPSPRFLLVAERIGPSNMNNIPFEAGPTGHMLSRVLFNTKTPLNAITITNMVKSHRGDTRKVNDKDLELFEKEIIRLKPKKVVFMGAISKQGIPIAKEHGCETGTIVHLGALNHRGIKDLTGYYNEWKKILGIVPSVTFQ